LTSSKEMLTYELETGTIGFIEVEQGAKDFEIVTNQSIIPYGKTLQYEADPFRGYRNYCGFDLPEGNWQPLSLFPQLKEEDVKDVMPKVEGLACNYFLDFTIEKHSGKFQYNCDTALESIHSLAQHLGLNAVNPIPNPEAQFDERGNGGYCPSWVDDWQEAQSKVKQYFVVFKPKN
jgi:hypothetical protein